MAPALVVVAPQEEVRAKMNSVTPRQNKTEASISDGMMAFQQEFVGRAPKRIGPCAVEIWWSPAA